MKGYDFLINTFGISNMKGYNISIGTFWYIYYNISCIYLYVQHKLI